MVRMVVSKCVTSLCRYELLTRWLLKCRERALQGWLFWRWDVPVYSGSHQEDYAVRPTDTTFRYLAAHAHMLRSIQNSRAPRADCSAKMGCWMAVDPEANSSTKLPADKRK